MGSVDAIVVGAGVVGLAIARALASTGRDTLVVEAAPRIGTGISSRSSEVIHAGLYYPPGSLKSRLCVEGRHRLYAFCESRGVPHRRLGKLVVAHDESQVAALEAIAVTARAAGVDDLILLEQADARAREPVVACAAALWSPSSGIVDSQALMLALLADAEAAGAVLAPGTRVTRVTLEPGGWRLHCGVSTDAAGRAGGEASAVTARWLVNAAGLGAQAVAQAIDALPASQVSPRFLAKGHYFAYSGGVPFRHLVYPVPEPGGLGTHLTLDLAGGARFGPDVDWVEREDYAVDRSRHARFVAAARRIWPGLDPERLQPAYAGIRPKVVGPGEPAADFVISGPEAHGLEGLINLFGIESPGLTASLAIAEEVSRRLGPR